MKAAILRIKGENGEWIEIPAVKGERGEQGISIDTIVFKNKVGTVSTYGIQLTNGKEYTFTVTNGNIIRNIALISTDILIDTYRISLDDGTHHDFTVTNGRGINGISKTGTDVLSDTYTISYNDGTTSTYNVTNGRGIIQITKTNTDVLTDTYTIYYNDNTTSTYTIKNGRGISYIEKDEVIGLSDRYTIHYNDGTTSHYHVVNGAAGPAGSIGNRIYLSGLVDKVNDETGYDRVKDLYDSSDGVVKIDTIKANNYTVSGTPTITDDGMFSANAVGDIIIKSMNNTITSELRWGGRFIYASKDVSISNMQEYIITQIEAPSDSEGASVTHTVYGQLNVLDSATILQIVDYSSTGVQNNVEIEIPLKDGDIFDIEFIYNDTTITLNATLNGTVNYTVSIDSPGLGILKNVFTCANQNYWAGEIDLNTVLVYVDGKLVYQPCLKIPYVKSKTGSKIVDAQWIKRVENCYNQYGSGNYYLLDTENEKFSLPMPDIYGLINTLEDKKVDRAGDIMTGPLTIITDTTPVLNVKVPRMDYNEVPDAHQYTGIQFNDVNGNRLGILEQSILNTGQHAIGINQRYIKDDGTYAYSSILTGFNADGVAFASAPNPANKLDNSTQIATTHWVREHRCTAAAGTSSTASIDAPCYVVQNYVNGTSWYRIWSDGWIEQGGQAYYPKLAANKTGSTSVTFPKPFISINYDILTNIVADGGNSWSIKVFAITKQVSMCYVNWATTHSLSGEGLFSWYACGY